MCVNRCVFVCVWLRQVSIGLWTEKIWYNIAMMLMMMIMMISDGDEYDTVAAQNFPRGSQPCAYRNISTAILLGSILIGTERNTTKETQIMSKTHSRFVRSNRIWWYFVPGIDVVTAAEDVVVPLLGGERVRSESRYINIVVKPIAMRVILWCTFRVLCFVWWRRIAQASVRVVEWRWIIYFFLSSGGPAITFFMNSLKRWIRTRTTILITHN